jgi:hypothetical protein
MICQDCQRKEATVHITTIDHRSNDRIERHFCPQCADAFRSADPMLRLAGEGMIDLRVMDVSPERTLLKVLVGTSDLGNWEVLTSRLRQLHVDPSVGTEFSIQRDDGWIEWLKGQRESPE